MASSKPRALCTAKLSTGESSVMQVLDSHEPLVACSSSDHPCGQVLDSSKSLVPGVSTESFSEPSTSHSSVTASKSPMSAESLSHDSDVGKLLGVSGASSRRTNITAQDLRSRWNLRKVHAKLGTEAQCIEFAVERGLLPTTKKCSYHKRPMTVRTGAGSGQMGIFRCTKSNCRTYSESRSKGTWFENAHLAVNLIFQVMYMYCYNYSYEQVQRETATEDGHILSTRTIADWFSYCRETVVLFQLKNSVSIAQGKIGGPRKIVKIYKSKFGNRKYNRGRHIDCHWVLGMIENGSDDLRLEVCPDNERSADILVPLIQKHVEEGSEIHTDLWRVYDCLPQYGYIHKKMNHTDPNNRIVIPDGVHTQRLESHWRYLQSKFNKSRAKGSFSDWLVEYMWRRNIKLSVLDPFEEILKAVKFVYKIE